MTQIIHNEYAQCKDLTLDTAQYWQSSTTRDVSIVRRARVGRKLTGLALVLD